MLVAALRYAGRGWFVLPLHTINRLGLCTCGKKGCASPGKHPQTPNGLLDATSDVSVVGRWDDIYGEAGWNVGIRTGVISGLFVLDVDPLKGGLESLRILEARFGPLPATPTVQTGSGGWHFYLRCPTNPFKSLAGALGPGLDIRAENGYVVAPPSRHVSGGLYHADRRA